MRIFSFSLLILLLISKVNAQHPNNEYEFIGALSTSEGDVLSYKIYFKEYENGKIEGVTTTDILGINNTQSSITGEFNRSKKTLSFKETNNIQTKSKEAKEIFCYVEASNLRIRTIQNKQVIKGDFIGKFSSGEQCANGKINLVSMNIVEEVQNTMKNLSIGEDTLKRIDSIINVVNESAKIKTLTNNESLLLNWNDDVIILDIWDGNKEDYDIIKIIFNDEVIDERLTIGKIKETITIPFKGENGVVKVIAIDEGYQSPNTVNFLVRNTEKSIPFISNLKKNEEIQVRFRKGN